MKVKVEIGQINSIADAIKIYGNKTDKKALATFYKKDFDDDWSTFTQRSIFLDALDVATIDEITCEGAELHKVIYTAEDQAELSKFNKNKIKLDHLNDLDWVEKNIEPKYTGYYEREDDRTPVDVYPSNNNVIASTAQFVSTLKPLFNFSYMINRLPYNSSAARSRRPFGLYKKESTSSSTTDKKYYHPYVSVSLDKFSLANISNEDRALYPEYYYSPSMVNILRNIFIQRGQTSKAYDQVICYATSAIAYSSEVTSSSVYQIPLSYWKGKSLLFDLIYPTNNTYIYNYYPITYGASPIHQSWKLPEGLKDLTGYFMGLDPIEGDECYRLPESAEKAKGLFYGTSIAKSTKTSESITKNINFFNNTLDLAHVKDASFFACSAKCYVPLIPKCFENENLINLRAALAYTNVVCDVTKDERPIFDVGKLLQTNVKDICAYMAGATTFYNKNGTYTSTYNRFYIPDFTIDLSNKSIDMTRILSGRCADFGVINVKGFKGVRSSMLGYNGLGISKGYQGTETTSINPYVGTSNGFEGSEYGEYPSYARSNLIKNMSEPGYMLVTGSGECKISTILGTAYSAKAQPETLLFDMSVLDYDFGTYICYVSHTTSSSAQDRYGYRTGTIQSLGYCTYGSEIYTAVTNYTVPSSLVGLHMLPYHQYIYSSESYYKILADRPSSTGYGSFWYDGTYVPYRGMESTFTIARTGQGSKANSSYGNTIDYNISEYDTNCKLSTTSFGTIVKPVYNIRKHMDTLKNEELLTVNINDLIKPNPNYPYEFKLVKIDNYVSLVKNAYNAKKQYIKTLMPSNYWQYFSTTNFDLGKTGFDTYVSGVDLAKTNFTLSEDGILTYDVKCLDIFDDSISFFTDFGYLDYTAEIDGYEFHGRTAITLNFKFDFTINEEVYLNAEVYDDDEKTDLIPNVKDDESESTDA